MSDQTTVSISYNDAVVRKFLLATVLWGIVGMLVGVVIALQLAYWPLNGSLPYFTFSRLRPLHTNAVIFAFAGNAIFAGIYYSTQRLLKTRMASDWISSIHFWGWQAIIVAAAITLPFGITTSKEYAELEWPIDLSIAIVWVLFGINLFATIAKRREKHIYVAIWFYIATVITVALLHVVNSLAIPVSFLKSYSVFAGVQDALVQWWYGHNAVAFFLTTPFLGLMYYFMPKAAGRPVYSYRLSIVHFWSLVFLYIWAGPHHLLHTALPDWAQTMGVVFSIMLIAPSWGGMINGLLTLRGAWDKLRTDTILKFMVTGITFYGMSTLEGPLLSLRSINSLAHYTDWIIGHVHGGALGWNGFIAFGMIYYLLPRLWKTPIYSEKLMSWHFWLGTLGIVMYITSMWASGITQGLMWRQIDPATGQLVYPDFLETVVKLIPFYWIRALGGTLYLGGVLLSAVNVVQTIRKAKKAGADLSDETVQVTAAAFDHKPEKTWHQRLEGKAFAFSMLTLCAVVVGGLAEIIPMIAVQGNKNTKALVAPYSPLELEGRDIYIREGCYTCHSQMIRTLPEEVLRYGKASEAGESVYDHPFQFGSKRTGPDLARVGTKLPAASWHFRHMKDPRETSPGSIMPAYPWLFENDLDTGSIEAKIKTMSQLGVPYLGDDEKDAKRNLALQAQKIAEQLVAEGALETSGDVANKEIVALIAYMQKLGKK